MTIQISKSTMLDAAIKLAEEKGYDKVTREEIAKKLNVATGTVHNRLGTMRQLKKEIVRKAMRTGNSTIIVQAIANKDPHIKKLPPEVRKAALMEVA